MVLEIVTPTDLKSWLAIIKIVVMIFTLVYAFDILILHRKFSDLGKAMASQVSILTLGIFVTLLSLAIGSFGILTNFTTIGEITGVAIIGIYFRSCVHSYIKKTGGDFWERIK